jgi:hypothetical protein
LKLAFGEQAKQGTQVSEWLPEFKSGTEDGECSEYSLIAKQLNLWRVQGPCSKNIKIITHAIANMFGISFGSHKSIFNDNPNYCQICTLPAK